MKFAKVCKLSVLIIATFGLVACASIDDQSTQTEATQADTAAPSEVAPAETVALDNEFGFLSDTNLTAEQLLAICTYYFRFDSTAILGANLEAVNAQARYLVANPDQKVLLKGYTDIQGSREYNIGLGYRRAQAVAKQLMSQGVNKNQIEMVSYGPEFPADSATNQHAYQKNRRAELAYCEHGSCKSVYGGGALKGAAK